MVQVLEQCDKVAVDFSPDSVHDLRVALRRCRSMADGLMALDPDPAWKEMKKAGKRLFQRLGDLRDIHVMEEWIEKLEKSEKTHVTAADSLADLPNLVVRQSSLSIRYPGGQCMPRPPSK